MKTQNKKKKKMFFNDLQVGHLTSHRRRVDLLKLSFEGKGDFGTTKAKSLETKSKLKIPQKV